MLTRNTTFLPIVVLTVLGVSQPSTATAGPESSDARVMKEDRMKILRDERSEIVRRLEKATADQSRAADKEAAEKAVARLQGDLTAIEKEIQRVEGQKPVNLTVKGPSEKAASAVQEGEAKAPSYRPWDVFKDFGK